MLMGSNAKNYGRTVFPGAPDDVSCGFNGAVLEELLARKSGHRATKASENATAQSASDAFNLMPGQTSFSETIRNLLKDGHIDKALNLLEKKLTSAEGFKFDIVLDLALESLETLRRKPDTTTHMRSLLDIISAHDPDLARTLELKLNLEQVKPSFPAPAALVR